LGVNATVGSGAGRAQQAPQFQWAPTLGGECYEWALAPLVFVAEKCVSMGTHPWG